MKSPCLLVQARVEGSRFAIAFDYVGLDVGSEHEDSSTERVVRLINFDCTS
jgi:hypothetical protein